MEPSSFLSSVLGCALLRCPEDLCPKLLCVTFLQSEQWMCWWSLDGTLFLTLSVEISALMSPVWRKIRSYQLPQLPGVGWGQPGWRWGWGMLSGCSVKGGG